MLDNPAFLACTRSRGTLYSTQQGCLTPQKSTPEMPFWQWHTEFAQG